MERREACLHRFGAVLHDDTDFVAGAVSLPAV